MSPKKDRLFESIRSVEDFRFDCEVAAVFDDMIRRSVPFYDEVQRMVVEVAVTFLRGGGYYYDIGCSTGTTITALAESLRDVPVQYVGIEPSMAMLEQARSNLAHLGERVELTVGSAQDFERLPNAQVVTMLYTLQFIRPPERLAVISMIRQSLPSGGCFILAEKILADTRFARRLYIDLYHQYKRNQGYSDSEISQKREALENVLIPYKNEENMALLKSAGFGQVEQAFRWYNFALYIAVVEH